MANLLLILAPIMQAVHAIVPGVSAVPILGARHAKEEGAPPRIVWVPMTERIGPPADYQQGSDTIADRILYTRFATIAAHVWGDALDSGGTPTQADSLLETLVSCVRFVCGAGQIPEGVTWLNTDGTDLTAEGAACVTGFTLSIPLLSQADGSQLAPLTSAPLDAQMGFPDGQTQ